MYLYIFIYGCINVNGVYTIGIWRVFRFSIVCLPDGNFCFCPLVDLCVVCCPKSHDHVLKLKKKTFGGFSKIRG